MEVSLSTAFSQDQKLAAVALSLIGRRASCLKLILKGNYTAGDRKMCLCIRKREKVNIVKVLLPKKFSAASDTAAISSLPTRPLGRRRV